MNFPSNFLKKRNMQFKQIETPFETNRSYYVNELGEVISVGANGDRRSIKGKIIEGSLHIDFVAKGNRKMRKVESIALS